MFRAVYSGLVTFVKTPLLMQTPNWIYYRLFIVSEDNPIRDPAHPSNNETNHPLCFLSQRNAFANDTIPSESYISAIQAAHLGTLSCQSLPLVSSLKHILLSLVRLTGDLIV